MHGGEVTARSDGPGTGVTFEVRLTLAAAPRLVAPQAEAQNASAKRVLVVDDNIDAANSLAQILNLTGHRAEPVYGPREALERAANFQPDIILLDIGLPGMDGYEVARRIRARGSPVRIVALTGYGRTRDPAHAVRAGFNAHTTKPATVEEVKNIVALLKSL